MRPLFTLIVIHQDKHVEKGECREIRIPIVSTKYVGCPGQNFLDLANWIKNCWSEHTLGFLALRDSEDTGYTVKMGKGKRLLVRVEENWVPFIRFMRQSLKVHPCTRARWQEGDCRPPTPTKEHVLQSCV